MNKLKQLLSAVFTLVLVNVGTAQADSSNFAGPYIGLSISGYGVGADGNSRSTSVNSRGGFFKRPCINVYQARRVTK